MCQAEDSLLCGRTVADKRLGTMVYRRQQEIAMLLK